MAETDGRRTVLLAFMADQGHFMFSLPLGRHLCKIGLRCELWTHDCCAAWVPEASPIRVMPVMGDGTKLRRFTDVYKRSAAMGGDSDVEGIESVCANIPRMLEEEGIDMPPSGPRAFTADDSGKGLFRKRLQEPDVAAVVWEGQWAAWAAALAKDAGVPSLGLGPSYLYQFRAFAGPLPGFDGECRLRDRLEDRVDPEFVGDFAWILAKALSDEILPPDGYSRVGAFIPSSEESACLSPDLDSWFAAPESSADQRPVTLLSLGSQSAIGVLSEWAEADLLKGCLAASPRVLAVSTSPVTDPELLAAAESGRLRIEQWVPQFAVLGHSHVQCFLSHCGANSTHEGLSQGVPIVPLPFFDDQFYIAARVEKLFDYAATAGEVAYQPLRKSLLRAGPPGAAVPLVAAAVRLGLAVPREATERLRLEVRGEAGVETVADMVMVKAGLK